MQAEPNRKLAAVMFTDVVGFSALMHKNESDGIQKRNRYKEVVDQCHKNRNGEIIQYLGDGTLSVFPNSVDAAWCAIEILKQLKEPIKVPLRIGIHSGNVLFETGDVLGDTVNIASRIESFSIPGGVMVSDSVQDQIKNQPGLEFVSLGKFRLKNIDRPFEIYAISTEGITVPDPSFLQGKGERLSNLMSNVPSPSTPLLGREIQVTELLALLRQNKIVTITGTGGMGKTRIATEICHRLADEFTDGITYVSLADVTDASALIPALADALGIKEAEGRTLHDAITSLIFDKKCLIVLDNLEQIISSAPVIAAVSSKCPNLRILTTSRTPLKVSAEREYVLRPLSHPPTSNVPLEELKDFPAIALFVERARKVKNNFELNNENASDVIQICQRLDGLPLAIELAAARIRILPPKNLLQRLEKALDVLTGGNTDSPGRHQTLRATIDWSYTLLTENEKQLFRRMAVFSEGFTIEAIEAVCYKTGDVLSLDELESLMDKGLVQSIADGDRFKMLQTIKEYAIEKLNEAGERDDVFDRHAGYYASVAEEICIGLENPGQKEWMDRGFNEEVNLYAALDLYLAKAKTGDADAADKGLGMCGALYFFWHISGKHILSHEYIYAFFSSPDCPLTGINRSRALLTAGMSSYLLGDMDKSVQQLLEAKELAGEDHDRLIALVEGFLSLSYMGISMESSKETAELCERRSRKIGFDYGLSIALTLNGLIQLVTGDMDASKKLLNDAMVLCRKIRNRDVGGVTLSILAQLESISKNHTEAIRLFKEAIEWFEEVYDDVELARVHSEMGWIYLEVNNPYAARNHFFESIALYEKIGSVRGIGKAFIGIAAVETVEQKFHRAIQISTAAELFTHQVGIVNMYTDDFPGKAYIDRATAGLTTEEIHTAKSLGSQLSVKETLALSKMHQN